jgi:catechol 2,3-dioxygenase-like lactoylglutathione lyase family enzyme
MPGSGCDRPHRNQLRRQGRVRARAAEFYDTVLGVLSHVRWISAGPSATGATASRRSGSPKLWTKGPNREIHLAFEAADEDAVRAFHQAALALGAESLHAPRLWPEYHPGYFGAFVRDPDGNNIEAVYHGS